VQRYGHSAVKRAHYTASAFLAKTLGDLSRSGDVLFHEGPATGRWSYNGKISWWALAPKPHCSPGTSWADTGLTMDYVPGNQEKAPGHEECGQVACAQTRSRRTVSWSSAPPKYRSRTARNVAQSSSLSAARTKSVIDEHSF